MTQNQQPEPEGDEALFLHLRQQQQSYALPVNSIREVLTEQKLTPIPRQPPEVLGTLNLRGEVLPVLSLGYMLHGHHREDQHHILILQREEFTYGLAVEEIERVWPHNEVEHHPLSEEVGYSDWVTGVVQHEGDLVMLLEPPERICHLTQQTQQEHLDLEAANEDSPESTTAWLSFWLEKQLMALPLACVSEVLQLSSCTRVPLSPPSVGGIINVRGQVVPVIHLGNRLGCCEESPWSYIILINHTYQDKPLLLGLTVHEVSTVLQIDPEQVQAPAHLEHITGRPCLAGLTTHQQEQVFLLSLDQLLDIDKLLDQVA